MADLKKSNRRVLVVHDSYGHCYAFDTDKPDVWTGLAFDCFSLGWLTTEEFREVVGMVGQGRIEDAYTFLDNKDCLGCDFHYVILRDEWENGLRSNVNDGKR